MCSFEFQVCLPQLTRCGHKRIRHSNALRDQLSEGVGFVGQSTERLTKEEKMQLWLHQEDEACLFEMMIKRQHVDEIGIVHHDE